MKINNKYMKNEMYSYFSCCKIVSERERDGEKNRGGREWERRRERERQQEREKEVFPYLSSC